MPAHIDHRDTIFVLKKKVGANFLPSGDAKPPSREIPNFFRTNKRSSRFLFYFLRSWTSIVTLPHFTENKFS